MRNREMHAASTGQSVDAAGTLHRIWPSQVPDSPNLDQAKAEAVKHVAGIQSMSANWHDSSWFCF